MRGKYITTLVMAVLSLAACSDNSSSAKVTRFIDGCTSSSNMGQEICKCTAEMARDTLSPAGFDFLIASMSGNEQEITEARSGLKVAEAMEAGMFMVNAPAKCAADK